MKRFISIMLAISLIFVVAYADTDEKDEKTYINIGLYYGNSAKTSVEITCDEETKTVNAEDIENSEEFESDNEIVSVNGTKYRGSIVVNKNSSGLLTVINRVDIEDYVASVIASEMSPSFNVEALKAQAVCARTYALRNKGKHSAYGFDLCTSTDCQTYKGISGESEKCTRATEETKGVVMTYKGAYVEAVYSATSGGYTEDVENVWGSDIPYLKAVEDTYESKSVYGSTWEKELTADEVTKLMNDRGYNIGNVTDIQVVSTSEHGAVLELKIVGTNGEKVFKKESCRWALNTNSQAYTVTPQYAEKKKLQSLFAYGGRALPKKVTVITAKGKSTVSLEGLFIKGSTQIQFDSQTDGVPTTYKLEGRGYGHLVGMSQNGANGMAEAGFDYEEILKHYYKGIDIN